jgi:predicted transposase YbfD/YdcC
VGLSHALVLAQRQVKEHSNEQTPLPLLLEQLEVAGCIVSIDAMGCLPKIAKQIKEQDGEHVLALKANQGTLYQDVVDLFADALIPRGADLVHDYQHDLSLGKPTSHKPDQGLCSLNRRPMSFAEFGTRCWSQRGNAEHRQGEASLTPGYRHQEHQRCHR